MKRKAARKKSLFREWIEALSIALLVVILVRGLVAEVYVIPTPSMEKTLLPGDFILVNKISYGSRLAQTPLSLPFFHQYIPFFEGFKSYLEWISLPYFRLPGTSSIKHNDVVVFNYPLDDNFPVDHKTHYVKRCVALPGDTLVIKNTQVIVNHLPLPVFPELQYDRIIKTASGDQGFIHEFEPSEGGRAHGKNVLNIPLTDHLANEISKDKRVVNIKKRIEKEGFFYDHIFPYDSNFPWNTDNFGPLIIPKAGTTVNINTKNIGIYQRIIENYELNELEIVDQAIKINGELVDSYTFKMDYYFMLGDNRHYSSDSRFWGFVPENHIVGKASSIIFSIKPKQPISNKIRMDRFFKSLAL